MHAAILPLLTLDALVPAPSSEAFDAGFEGGFYWLFGGRKCFARYSGPIAPKIVLDGGVILLCICGVRMCEKRESSKFRFSPRARVETVQERPEERTTNPAIC
jgi:hypothetical protein